jgi:hypothetical protein
LISQDAVALPAIPKEPVSSIVSINVRSYFWRYLTRAIPNDLIELQARFDQWRSPGKDQREPMPDELRKVALEMSRQYPQLLLRQVL